MMMKDAALTTGAQDLLLSTTTTVLPTKEHVVKKPSQELLELGMENMISAVLENIEISPLEQVMSQELPSHLNAAACQSFKNKTTLKASVVTPDIL